MVNMTSFGLKRRWLQTSTIFAALILLMPGKSSAQLAAIYVSPGLQLGYTPGQGASLSAQVTLGLFTEVPAPIEILIPGITFGKRWSEHQTMTYIDAQLSYFFVGAGVGRVWIRKKGEDRVVAAGRRFKAWGGWLINFTYDSYRTGDDPPIYQLGVIGVLPIPVILLGGIGALAI